MQGPKKRIAKNKLAPAGRYNTSGFFGPSSSFTVIRPAVLGRPPTPKPVEVQLPIDISDDADAGEGLDEDLSMSPVEINEAAPTVRQLARPEENFATWPHVENYTLVYSTSSKPEVNHVAMM
jgi:hypothetical protein